MANVFIVRAFGDHRPVIKKNKEGVPEIVYFNFDRVETDLIKPAMKALNLSGGTTGEVFASGEIREDMFSELLLADIVIADITIYNANVYYELGIRHALRNKRTILMQCPGYDEAPFDIKGYRYICYEQENPAEALDLLIRTLKETMDGDRVDSPVFNMLPKLSEQDREKFHAMPADFVEEVIIARDTKSIGKLNLLAYEAESFSWNIPAFRLIGEALFKLKAFDSARELWEKIEALHPGDTQASDRLATVYQRLAETEFKTNPEEALELLAKSDLAIDTLLKNDQLSISQMAETYALKARNAKTRWFESWKNAEGDVVFKKALQSLALKSARTNYEKGFFQDLNHFYSGINALGMLVTTISLAEKLPQIWELDFESTEEAEIELKKIKTRYQRISNAVEVSIEAAKIRQEAKGEPDPWLNITEADFLCLTSDKPARVGNIYAQVILEAGDLNMDASTRQLKMYERLQVKPENVKAALEAMPSLSAETNELKHYVLFTGHMIDKDNRSSPRFPKSKEEAVKARLKETLLAIKEKIDPGYALTGISGGACGGDILFHEVCQELEIPSQMYLALPREEFIVASVSFAGPDWIDRFDQLYKKLPHPVLAEHEQLPRWLHKKSDYTIWVRNNLWLLNTALVKGGMNMTLVALWDGGGGDGPGGTEHMVEVAKKRGAKTRILDIKSIG